MSNTGRDGDLIPDDTKVNYERLRLERGMSWQDLADQFARDAAAVPLARARGYAQLAQWAQSQAAAEQPAKRRARGRQQAATDANAAPAGPASHTAPSGPLQTAQA